MNLLKITYKKEKYKNNKYLKFFPNFQIFNNEINEKSFKPNNLILNNIKLPNLNINILQSVGQIIVLGFNIKLRNIEYFVGTCSYIKILNRKWFLTCLHTIGYNENYFPLIIYFVKSNYNILNYINLEIIKFKNYISKNDLRRLNSFKNILKMKFEEFLKKEKIYFLEIFICFEFLEKRKIYIENNRDTLFKNFNNLNPIPCLDIILLYFNNNINLFPLEIKILKKDKKIKVNDYYLLSYQKPCNIIEENLINNKLISEFNEKDFINEDFSISFLKIIYKNDKYINFIGNTTNGSSGGLIFDKEFNLVGMNFGCFYDIEEEYLSSNISNTNFNHNLFKYNSRLIYYKKLINYDFDYNNILQKKCRKKNYNVAINLEFLLNFF